MLPFPFELSKLMCILLGHQVGNNTMLYLERNQIEHLIKKRGGLQYRPHSSALKKCK